MPDLFSRIVTMYRNKVGLKPTTEEIITADEVKTAYSSGNGNWFVGHSVPADPSSRPEDQLSIYQPRWSLKEGLDDDGEHGSERSLLKALTDNEITNALIVVSKWFVGKI